MRSVVTVERARIEADVAQGAAEEAKALIAGGASALHPAYNAHNVTTDPVTESGYLVLQSVNPGASRVLRSETPNLWHVSTILRKIPYGKRDPRAKRHSSLLINYSPLGGEVSRHSDAGPNERDWVARYATLQGIGEMFVYDDSEIVQQVILRQGDVGTHFNPADRNLRPEHRVENIGSDMRISLGVLVALKKNILGKPYGVPPLPSSAAH